MTVFVFRATIQFSCLFVPRPFEGTAPKYGCNLTVTDAVAARLIAADPAFKIILRDQDDGIGFRLGTAGMNSVPLFFQSGITAEQFERDCTQHHVGADSLLNGAEVDVAGSYHMMRRPSSDDLTPRFAPKAIRVLETPEIPAFEDFIYGPEIHEILPFEG